MSKYSGLIVRGSLLLMESLWVYALVAWFVAFTVEGDRPTFLGVAVVVSASFGISRALQNSELSLGILRFWGALLSIVIFYAIVRFDFWGDLRLWDLTFLDDLFFRTDETLTAGATGVIAIPVLWGFWIRGVLRGQQSLTFDDVLRSFTIGVVIVAFVSLMAGVESDLPRAVDFVAIPYIAVGLLAIGLAHTARASDQFDRGFGSEWLVFAGGGVLALGLFALVFVVVDFDAARDGLAFIGRGVGFVFAGLLYVIVWPILTVMTVILEALRFLIDLWGGEKNDPIEDEQGEIGGDPNRPPADSPLPGWVETVTRVIVGGALVTALLIGTALLFTRFRRETQADEARESTYQDGRFASDLSDMLNSFLGRFRGQPRQADGQLEPARRLYFEMLDTAAARGVERRPMETPLELVPRIGRAISGEVPAEITRVFDDVRYGSVTPSEEELRRLRDEWEQLPK